MAKKEVLTDFWVRDILKEANIDLHPQGSNIKEIDEALKTASKAGTGKVGFPEYCGVVKDFVLIIENKADVSQHIKRNDKDVICSEVANVKNYAVNGALFYGLHFSTKRTLTNTTQKPFSKNKRQTKRQPKKF